MRVLAALIASLAFVGSLAGTLPTSETTATAELGGDCGGNCPGGCDSCPCGSSPNYQSISQWCAQFSEWDQDQCQCIVSHESGGNANAINENSNGSYDVGMWQVNSQNWASCSGGSAPCDPSTNLQCAIDVWRWGGNTFKLWSTCSYCGAC
mmetsp:Transcript_5185/g.11602  ORF Transcript_5185/g.11602 Transcript_5185/m.11602 type:complete len:151 (+) Transcript_5185:31-483(+)